MTARTNSSINTLPALLADANCVNMVVEAQRGCRNKYKYNPETGLFNLHKILPLGMFFPYDFGFIPSTQGDDGDPIDVMVFMDEPTFPGCIARVRILGIIKAKQRDAHSPWVQNNRLLAVPMVTHLYREWKNLQDIPEAMLFEIEHFFVSYNAAQKREFKIEERAGVRDAMTCVKEAALSAETV
jgi:inorganic pyrophosphatase